MRAKRRLLQSLVASASNSRVLQHPKNGVGKRMTNVDCVRFFTWI